MCMPGMFGGGGGSTPQPSINTGSPLPAAAPGPAAPGSGLAQDTGGQVRMDAQPQGLPNWLAFSRFGRHIGEGSGIDNAAGAVAAGDLANRDFSTRDKDDVA